MREREVNKQFHDPTASEALNGTTVPEFHRPPLSDRHIQSLLHRAEIYEQRKQRRSERKAHRNK